MALRASRAPSGFRIVLNCLYYRARFLTFYLVFNSSYKIHYDHRNHDFRDIWQLTLFPSPCFLLFSLLICFVSSLAERLMKFCVVFI